MSRSNQGIVTLSVTDPATGETRNLGRWDKRTGGGVDSEESVYTAAAGERVSLGGTVNPDNVTVARLYDLTRDHTQIGWLLALVGRGTGVITEQRTNTAYVTSGSPTVWRGTLKRCTPPEVDSESNDPALLELEFTIAGSPTSA